MSVASGATQTTKVARRKQPGETRSNHRNQQKNYMRASSGPCVWNPYYGSTSEICYQLRSSGEPNENIAETIY